jgi:excisionase family DNA binding protein
MQYPPGVSELIRTGAAAKILGTSRQHVVDLCARGTLRNHGEGVHRRLDRREVDALRGTGPTREQRQSLWLHTAVAGRVVKDPDGSLKRARANIARMRAAHRGPLPWLDDWERLIRQGPGTVVQTLVADTPEATELRQNSPFAGVLSEVERHKALTSFRSVDGTTSDAAR